MRRVIATGSFVVALILGLGSLTQAAVNALPTVVPLNIMWRVKVGGDYMTTTNTRERNSYPSDGAIYYIPQQSITNTAPYYRLRNSSNTDHMDSLIAGEGGYITEGHSVMHIPLAQRFLE